jgi:hypothetical protein
MSADNFLGIYKVNNRKYIGRGCWSECEKNECNICSNRIIFTAKSITEAVKLAQATCNDIDQCYEYGYQFINI